MPQILVRITTSELSEMARSGMRLWGTPGEGVPYWAREPRFSFDDLLAAPEDFLSANGYADMEDVPPSEVFQFMVEMPAPPRA